MPSRPSAAEAARWITRDSDLVAHIVEEILREEAWWTAVRARKHAHLTVVWADGKPEKRDTGVQAFRRSGRSRTPEHPNT
jgi:hypothetical protein